MEKIETLNITLKINDHQVAEFQRFLDEHFNVISYKVMPDTEKMYATDTTFQKLVKAKKEATKVVGIYINDNNNKYKELILNKHK
tara:strand:+ start:559 stop:813 length:255 start_codon:yes stop_codon:yes gene_type:complete